LTVRIPQPTWWTEYRRSGGGANVELTADRLHKILSSGAAVFEVFFPERDDVGNIIANTLKRDTIRSRKRR